MTTRKAGLIRKYPRFAVLLVWLVLPALSSAQDIEPRRWTHLPDGLNVAGAAYVYTDGDLFFDPVLLVDDAQTEQHTLLGSYTRAFGLAGRSARLDVIVPIRHANWDGLLDGVFTEVNRDGLGDPVVRFSINLAGAPALKGKEFRGYRAAQTTSTTVGAGLSVVLPIGEYKKDKLLNLGGNRFILQPQIGILHTRGPWSYELTASVLLFEDNDEFWNGNEHEQDPIYSLQAHVIRVFQPGYWLALSAAYGKGGESEINTLPKDDPRDTVLSAISFGVPIARGQGLKFVYVRGRAQENIGADTDNFIVGWTKRF